jgi:beta-mannanase
VTLLREEGAPFLFQQNFNRINFDFETTSTPLRELYAGDDYVDMIVITNYNRAFTTRSHNEFQSFRDGFDVSYSQAREMSSRPIGVAEMSSVSTGGDKPQWINNAFNDLVNRYEIAQITWFLYNRPVDGAVWDWDINSNEELREFKRGVELLEVKS